MEYYLEFAKIVDNFNKSDPKRKPKLNIFG